MRLSLRQSLLCPCCDEPLEHHPDQASVTQRLFGAGVFGRCPHCLRDRPGGHKDPDWRATVRQWVDRELMALLDEGATLARGLPEDRPYLELRVSWAEEEVLLAYNGAIVDAVARSSLELPRLRALLGAGEWEE